MVAAHPGVMTLVTYCTPGATLTLARHSMMSSTLRPEITWSVVKNRSQSDNCQAPTESEVKILDFKHELKLPNKNEKHIKCQKNMTEARRPIGTKLPHQV